MALKVPAALLWLLSFLLMFGIARHQRRSGPTWPVRGEILGEAGPLPYTFPRSADTDAPLRIEAPRPAGAREATVLWRRYPLSEPFVRVPMESGDEGFAASLPAQPAAGKIEYHVEITDEKGTHVLPSGRNAVLRFKDPVPAWALVPHVLLMFLAVVSGFRTTLEALLGRPRSRPLARATLVLLALGGLVFGPIVQKYAFGEAWTGVPFGWDLTDNKTLLMALCWVGALVVLELERFGVRARRIAVLAAGLLMTAVYLVPHSMLGSQLDYTRVEQGVDPRDAVGTGGLGR
jgi:hypothetical protein